MTARAAHSAHRTSILSDPTRAANFGDAGTEYYTGPKSTGYKGMYQVRLLGGFALEDPSGAQLRFRTRKTAALFAYLAFFSGRAHQREVLADWFWPEATGDAARQSLRMALSDIRKVLADQEVVRADREAIEVDAARLEVDTDRFREMVRQGGRDSLARAVDLHSGPLLKGSEEDWVMPQRSALEEEFAQAVVRLMALYSEAGEFSEGLAVGKRALAQVGDREDIHIGLIRLYAQSGAPSLAIAQYEELERHLDEEWGEQPSDAARMALEAVPHGAAMPAQSNFDAPTGRIFGREAALDLLAKLVLDEEESRVLTLHGPAGSGKTTLARHLAAKLARPYTGRCWVVDLTTCESLDALPSAIAAAVGVSGVEPSAQLAACIHAMQSARSLLVLDNLEHLLPHGSSVVAGLAAGAAPLRIVVTSRRIMELDGERVIPIPPLELPGHEATLEEIQAAPAVQMFVARASAANPKFRLSPDNARSVVALCRHLEGLPLSIALAAQRASNQSPAQILAALSSPSGNPRIGEGRHGSLDSALRWSLDLVSTEEAQCFIAVSQFRTPFTAEDAAQVAADPRAEERLGELVKSGLVVCDADGERAEFHLFELFKEVGRGLQGDLAREIAIRHFEWARGLAQGAEEHADVVLGPREADLFAAFAADVPQEVLGEYILEIEPWLVATDRLKRIADVLRRAYHGVSRPGLKARLGILLILAIANVGEINETLETATRVMALARESGEEDTIIRALIAFGNTLKATGDYAEAEALYVEAVERCERTRDIERLANSLYSLGLVRYCVSDGEGSLQYHLRALDVARQGTDYRTLVRILFDLGSELVKQGQAEKGLALVEESVALARELGIVRLEGLALWQEGEARRSLGQGPEAVQSLAESVRLVRKAGFEAGLNWIGLTIAGTLVLLEEWSLATRILARMTMQREADSRPLAGYELDDASAIREQLIAGCGQARFDRAWGEGARSDWPTLASELDTFAAKLAAEPARDDSAPGE